MASSKPFSLPNSRKNSTKWNDNAGKHLETAMVAPVVQVVVAVRLVLTVPTVHHFRQTGLSGHNVVLTTPTLPPSINFPSRNRRFWLSASAGAMQFEQNRSVPSEESVVILFRESPLRFEIVRIG